MTVQFTNKMIAILKNVEQTTEIKMEIARLQLTLALAVKHLQNKNK